MSKYRIVLLVMPLLPLLAGATVLEDPDEGSWGDFLRFFAAPGEEPSEATRDTAAWVEKVRADRGVTAPLSPVAPGEVEKAAEEPPLAPDEVRFAVHEEEGWIEYLVQDDTVSLNRDAAVAYGEMTLTADEVRFYSGKDLVVAEGWCELTEPNQNMVGRRMAYDLGSEKGVVVAGDASSAQGYYRGARIKKLGDKVIAAQAGSFTTCDLGEPHYHFWSPKLKVYLEDKVVAKPAVLYVGEVPVAATPYYFFSLRKDRHSGFLPPYIRYVRDGDFTVNNGYYWVWNESSDLTMLLDYNSVRGWQKSANLVYLYGSRSTVNNLYVSHLRERDTSIEWWKVYGSHRQDFTERCAGLLRLDFRNSKEYDYYLEPDFEVRTQEDMQSFANLTQSWENHQLSVEAERTVSKVSENPRGAEAGSLGGPPGQVYPIPGILQTTSDPLPRVSFYASQSQVGRTGFYYGYNASAVNFYSWEAEETVLRQSTVNASLGRPFSLLRYLRVDPNLGGRGDVFDRDRYGRNVRGLATYNTTTGISTKVYGIFPAGERVYRHVVNPGVTHFFQPKVDQSWMVEGGYIIPEANTLNFSLHQDFDVKLPEKERKTEEEKGTARPRSWEDVYRPSRTGLRTPVTEPVQPRGGGAEGRVITLARWDTSASYILNDPLPGQYRWSDLSNVVEITPNFAPWYDLAERVAFTNDLRTGELEDLDLTTSLSFSSAAAVAPEDEPGRDPYGRQREKGSKDLDPNVYNIDTLTGRRYDAGEGMGRGWNLSLTHDYSWDRDGFELHTAKGALSFDLTRKWRLGYDTYYDIQEGRFISEHYRIYRNLHRWEAELRISFERRDVIYWFQVRLIDIPEVQVYGTRARSF